MTHQVAPAQPVWKCADCDTSNDLVNAQCIVCGGDRPVSRVRINVPNRPSTETMERVV